MDIKAYLDRIGYQGPRDPNEATLKAVHRAHLLAIPYENLDVQFRTPLTTDPAAAYAKIVGRRRGGWCYEMNGLLGWALGELGFKVTRLCGANSQGPGGTVRLGPHLVLRIDLDRIWLADVGYGDGPIEAYPLVEGPIEQRGFQYRLEQRQDGWWRFHNHALGMSPFFDVNPDFSDEAALSSLCAWLQSDPASPFVPNAVHLRHTPGGQINLIGRKLRGLEHGERWSRLLEDEADYLATLEARFGLTIPEAASLWPQICARHEQLFGSGA
jgi:N-hydroxyarylamine O-acetyltransferase